MAIILDADVIIRGEKGSLDLATWMADLADERFEVAAITVAELRHGVERSTAVHKARRERYLRAILEGLAIIPYTEATAFEHARIWALLGATGRMIGYYDIIVAATAMERGSTVATFNKRHFNQVKGLQVIEPK
ncbi:MAG: PIN domain-containing protein [Candidatus Sulfotelmatobacter sp.]|jgi:predicted nucleic acid-binding protein